MDLKSWATSFASRSQKLARDGIAYVNRQLDQANAQMGVPDTLNDALHTSIVDDERPKREHAHNFQRFQGFQNSNGSGNGLFSFIDSAKHFFDHVSNEKNYADEWNELHKHKVLIRYAVFRPNFNVEEAEGQMGVLSSARKVNTLNSFSAESAIPKFNTSSDMNSKNAFVLPSSNSVKEVPFHLIRKYFPLSGKFWFRFKIPIAAENNLHNNYVWVDINGPQTLVPVFNGEIHMNVLVLPSHVDLKSKQVLMEKDTLSTISHLMSEQQQLSAPHVPTPTANSNKSFQTSAPEASPTPTDEKLPSVVAKDIPAEPTTSDWFFEDVSSSQHNGPEMLKQLSSMKLNEDTAKSSASISPIDVFDADEGAELEASNSKSQAVTANGNALSRKELAANRIYLKNKRIQEKLDAAKQMRDAEAAKFEGKLTVSDSVKEQMRKWTKGPSGNWKDIRTLLSSLHEVVWVGCEWEPQPLSSLMNSAYLKTTYRKGLLLFHPDRHQQAPSEQQYRAEIIFQALNESFKLSTF